MEPDIDVGEAMGLLSYINPFNKVVDRASDIIDQAVEDVDEKNRLKASLEELRLRGSEQVERSYQIALQTKTHWLFDGIHKLGRQLISAAVAYAGYDLIQEAIAAGVEINMDFVFSIVALGGPAALYTVIKGRGKP